MVGALGLYADEAYLLWFACTSYIRAPCSVTSINVQSTDVSLVVARTKEYGLVKSCLWDRCCCCCGRPPPLSKQYIRETTTTQQCQAAAFRQRYQFSTHQPTTPTPGVPHCTCDLTLASARPRGHFSLSSLQNYEIPR